MAKATARSLLGPGAARAIIAILGFALLLFGLWTFLYGLYLHGEYNTLILNGNSASPTLQFHGNLFLIYGILTFGLGVYLLSKGTEHRPTA